MGVVIGLTCRLHREYHAHRKPTGDCVDCKHLYQHVARLQHDAQHFGFELHRHGTTRNLGAFFTVGCTTHPRYGVTKDSGSCQDCHILYRQIETLAKRVEFENDLREEYVTKNPTLTPTGRNVTTLRYGLDMHRYRW